MAWRAALAGVSFLAAVSPDGDGIYPECRIINLLRFPLSYRSYFLIRLVYGSLDPATAVASLWLLGIDIGIGVARPSLLPWATIVLLTFALVNLVLARMLFAWLERWLAQRRTREIMGILFFLFILSFQLIGPLIAVYEHRSIPETRILGQKLSDAQRPLPPGLAAAAIAGVSRASQPASGEITASVFPFLLLVCYGIAFLWLLNFRLRAEYRGENLSESAGRKVSVRAGFQRSARGGICREFRDRWLPSSKKNCAISVAAGRCSSL